MRTYWRSGVVLTYENDMNKALIKSDVEDKKIYIWISGNESTRRSFLAIIRQNLDYIHRTIPKINAKGCVPFKGVDIDYNHLLTLEKQHEIYFIPVGLNEKVSVSMLLDGVDENRPLQTINEDFKKMNGLKRNEKVGDLYQASSWEKIVTVSAAIIILVLFSYLLVRNQPFADPNLVVIARTFLSLCASALGATIPGFLHIGWSKNGLLIRAGGALALFVLSLVFTPEVISNNASIPIHK